MKFKNFPLFLVGLTVCISGPMMIWARPCAASKSTEDWCLHHCSRLHKKCSTLLPEQVETCYVKCWVKPSQHPSISQCKVLADKKIQDILKHLDHEPAIRVVVAYEGLAEQEVEKKSLALQKWKRVFKKIMHLIKSTTTHILVPETEKKNSFVRRFEISKIYGIQKHSAFSDMDQDHDDFVPISTLVQLPAEKQKDSQSKEEVTQSIRRAPKYGLNFRRDQC